MSEQQNPELGSEDNQCSCEKLEAQKAEIERLRALLSMARDCLPDGDYSVRVMAVKEIEAALAGATDETSGEHS